MQCILALSTVILKASGFDSLSILLVLKGLERVKQEERGQPSAACHNRKAHSPVDISGHAEVCNLGYSHGALGSE